MAHEFGRFSIYGHHMMRDEHDEGQALLRVND